MQEILRMGLVLMVVCALSAAALAVTHGQTEPIIEEQRQRQLEETQQMLLPVADRFEEEPMEQEEEGLFYLGYEGETLVGVIALVAQGGYAGDIDMMVGLDLEGEITGVEIVDHEETPGLGARITEEEFLQQFAGTTMGDSLILEEDLEGITGATISTQAVARGVDQGRELVAERYLGEVQEVLVLTEVPDGTYEGEAEAFGGPLRVRVEVRDGTMTVVEVLEHEESPGVADPALEKIPDAIIEEQQVDVDVVTGATWTSQGIMEAVRDALKEYLVEAEGS